MEFFKRFQGPVALRKRVYRFDASDGAWQFTGGVFVSFDTPKNAKKFLNMFSEQNLIYNDSDGKNPWLNLMFQYLLLYLIFDHVTSVEKLWIPFFLK